MGEMRTHQTKDTLRRSKESRLYFISSKIFVTIPGKKTIYHSVVRLSANPSETDGNGSQQWNNYQEIETIEVSCSALGIMENIWDRERFVRGLWAECNAWNSSWDLRRPLMMG